MYGSNEDNEKWFLGVLVWMQAVLFWYCYKFLFCKYDAEELQGEECSSKPKGYLYQISLLYSE
jgi:hypothetical protein